MPYTFLILFVFEPTISWTNYGFSDHYGLHSSVIIFTNFYSFIILVLVFISLPIVKQCIKQIGIILYKYRITQPILPHISYLILILLNLSPHIFFSLSILHLPNTRSPWLPPATTADPHASLHLPLFKRI